MYSVCTIQIENKTLHFDKTKCPHREMINNSSVLELSLRYVAITDDIFYYNDNLNKELAISEDIRLTHLIGTRISTFLKKTSWVIFNVYEI